MQTNPEIPRLTQSVLFASPAMRSQSIAKQIDARDAIQSEKQNSELLQCEGHCLQIKNALRNAISKISFSNIYNYIQQVRYYFKKHERMLSASVSSCSLAQNKLRFFSFHNRFFLQFVLHFARKSVN